MDSIILASEGRTWVKYFFLRVLLKVQNGPGHSGSGLAGAGHSWESLCLEFSSATLGSEGSGNKVPRRLKPVHGEVRTEKQRMWGLGKVACNVSLLQQPCPQLCAQTLRTEKRHFRGQPSLLP